MHRMEVAWLLSALVLMPLTVTAQQDHLSSHQREASVMAFDQDRTTHHFYLFNDGGAIEVSVNHPSDQTNRDAIRAHLPHIAVMFAGGNFNAPMLVHDSKNVPGTRTMSSLKDRIRYAYVEVPDGGRVNIVTTDPVALGAVHEFLKFQIREHKTGESTAVQSR